MLFVRDDPGGVGVGRQGEQVTEYDARQYQATVLNTYDPANWTQSMIWGRVYWDQPQKALNVPSAFNGRNAHGTGGSSSPVTTGSVTVNPNDLVIATVGALVLLFIVNLIRR